MGNDEWVVAYKVMLFALLFPEPGSLCVRFLQDQWMEIKSEGKCVEVEEVEVREGERMVRGS